MNANSYEPHEEEVPTSAADLTIVLLPAKRLASEAGTSPCVSTSRSACTRYAIRQPRARPPGS
jgi:hypothetical protein